MEKPATVFPDNFVAFVGLLSGNSVPLRFQFQKDNTLVVIAEPQKGHPQELVALEMIEHLHRCLMDRKVEHSVYTRETPTGFRIDMLKIGLAGGVSDPSKEKTRIRKRCPECSAHIKVVSPGSYHCPSCGRDFTSQNNIGKSE